MAAKNNPGADEFTLVRVFDAPRELVWKAWTDPAHLAKWWGPRPMTSRCELDVRAGGAYRITMVDEGGGEYPMKGVFREVVPFERLVFTNDLSEHPDSWHDLIDPARDRNGARPSIDAVTTVTFADDGARTRMTVHMRFPTAALRDSFVKTGMTEGWTQSFVRLDELMAPARADRTLASWRMIDAPRALVWEALTRPEHLAEWWGPNGFRTTTSQFELAPGGTWRFVMHGPDGTDYPNEHRFVEIDEPRRIVYEHVSEPRHRVSINLEEHGDQTRVSHRSELESAEVRDQMVKKFGAAEGMEQHLDRLRQFAAGLSAR